MKHLHLFTLLVHTSPLLHSNFLFIASLREFVELRAYCLEEDERKERERESGPDAALREQCQVEPHPTATADFFRCASRRRPPLLPTALDLTSTLPALKDEPLQSWLRPAPLQRARRRPTLRPLPASDGRRRRSSSSGEGEGQGSEQRQREGGRQGRWRCEAYMCVQA